MIIKKCQYTSLIDTKEEHYKGIETIELNIICFRMIRQTKNKYEINANGIVKTLDRIRNEKLQRIF